MNVLVQELLDEVGRLFQVTGALSESMQDEFKVQKFFTLNSIRPTES